MLHVSWSGTVQSVDHLCFKMTLVLLVWRYNKTLNFLSQLILKFKDDTFCSEMTMKWEHISTLLYCYIRCVKATRHSFRHQPAFLITLMIRLARCLNAYNVTQQHASGLYKLNMWAGSVFTEYISKLCTLNWLKKQQLCIDD